MADKTGIEWTEATWNPIVGCTAVSPGCDHCYAAREASGRLRNLPLYAGLAQGGTFTGEVRLVPDRLDQPLRWKRPRRIFVNSMADLFHDAVPDEFIVDVFARMWWASHHVFQVLTKRHGRMRALMPRIEQGLRQLERDLALVDAPTPLQWPLPNVWLGVSVENQKWANIRIPALLETPAAVRWISAEPLLGPVNLHAQDDGLRHWLPDFGPAYDDGSGEPVCQAHGISRCGQGCAFLDWVVVGGESGPGARPMHPAWARGLRDQCVAAGVPFLFKQWGEWGPAPWCVKVCDPAVGWHGTDAELAAAKALSEATGATHSMPVWSDQYDNMITLADHKPWSLERCSLPEDTHAPMRRWGKKVAGRDLDGRTWDEYPAVAHA